MLPDVVNQPGGFLDRVSNFIGMDRSDLEVGETLTTISNCNTNKGSKATCGNTTSQRYEISGGRNMLAATRELIYILFAEECKIWNEEFRISYPACLNALSP